MKARAVAAETSTESVRAGARVGAGRSALDRQAADQLAARIGVTRVARVTGLDRAGIEVACAVRPGGHVLQVSNGKGLDAAQARAGALLEAAELWAAENPDPSRLIAASFRELEEQGAVAWRFDDQLALPELFSGRLRIAWVRAIRLGVAASARHSRSAVDLHGNDLHSNVLIPASLVHCVPASGPWLGVAAHRWTSNGMGAHPDGERALCHALLEAAERDGLARSLPQGWTNEALQTRIISTPSLAGVAPRAAALVAGLRTQGLVAHLFDLHPEPWMGLALAGALLIDEEQGPIPVAAGYACARNCDEALTRALLEAAQSRLTDVHGAREDIEASDRQAMLQLARACSKVRGGIPASAMMHGARDAIADERSGALGESARLLRILAAAGVDHLAAIDLAPASLPVRVIKIVAPGLLLSGLL